MLTFSFNVDIFLMIMYNETSAVDSAVNKHNDLKMYGITRNIFTWHKTYSFNPKIEQVSHACSSKTNGESSKRCAIYLDDIIPASGAWQMGLGKVKDVILNVKRFSTIHLGASQTRTLEPASHFYSFF